MPAASTNGGASTMFGRSKHTYSPTDEETKVTKSNNGAVSVQNPPHHVKPKPTPSTTTSKLPPPTKFGDLGVFFKNPDVIDVGDVVHGWVELNVQHPIRALALLITFYGEAHFEIAGELDTTKATLKRGRVEMRQFERVTHPLWQVSKAAAATENRPPNIDDIAESAVCLDKGLFVYDFYVGTARSLPSSFVSKGTVKKVTYFCEVTLLELLSGEAPQQNGANGCTGTNGHGNVAEKGIEFTHTPCHTFAHVKRKELALRGIGSFVPNPGTAPGSHHSISSKAMLRVRNVLDMSGNIVATVTLAKQVYQPGQHIRFNAELLNCFRHLKVDVLLVQRAKCLIDGCIHAVRQDIIRERLGTLRSDDTYQFWHGRCLWIPSPAIVPVDLRLIYPGRLINVQNAFVLRIKPRCRKPLEIEIPIVIDSPASARADCRRTTGTSARKEALMEVKDAEYRTL